MPEIRTTPPRITDIEWNALIEHGLTKAVDDILYLTGSTYNVVDKYGKLVYSGSNYATVKNQLTGSLSGIITDLVEGTMEGYSNGSLGLTIDFTGSISGNVIATGSSFSITNLIATNVTGSNIVSGSSILGQTGTITFVNSNSVTGSNIVSGSYIVSSHGTTRCASYIIYSGSGIFWAENGRTGNIDYSGSDSTFVVQSAITASSSGSKIFFLSAIYPITGSINVNKPLILEGEHAFGDMFFINDSVYYGVTKNGVVLVDDSADGIDVLKLGYINATYPIQFGTHVKNLCITGNRQAGTVSDTTFKTGSAITIRNVNNVILENLTLYRKEYGIYTETSGSSSPLPRNDIIMCNNICLAYNKRGIKVTGGTEHLYMNNIFGYVNQYEMLDIDTYYDVHISNVLSNADAIQSNSVNDPCIFISSGYGNIHLKDVLINGAAGASNKPPGTLFIQLSSYKTGSMAFLNNIIVQGSRGNAIDVDGGLTGSYVFINNLYVGAPDNDAILDGVGSAAISGSVVNVFDSSPTKVKINGGYVNCVQSKTLTGWFYGVDSGSYIKNVENFTTEAFGWASGSSGATILHGLNAIPYHIQVTSSGSVPMLFSTETDGVTGFKVYHTGSGVNYFFWEAKA